MRLPAVCGFATGVIIGGSSSVDDPTTISRLAMGSIYTREQYDKLSSFDVGYEGFVANARQNGQIEVSNVHWPNSCHRTLTSDGISWIVQKKNLWDLVCRVSHASDHVEAQQIVNQIYLAFKAVQDANGSLLVMDCPLGLYAFRTLELLFGAWHERHYVLDHGWSCGTLDMPFTFSDMMISDWPIFGIFEMVRNVLVQEDFAETEENNFCKQRGFSVDAVEYRDAASDWMNAGNWTSKPPLLSAEEMAQEGLCPLALTTHYFAKAYWYLHRYLVMDHGRVKRNMLSQRRYKKFREILDRGEYHLVRFAGLPTTNRKAYDGTACAMGRNYMYHVMASRYPTFAFLHLMQLHFRQLYSLSAEECAHQEIDSNLMAGGLRHVCPACPNPIQAEWSLEAGYIDAFARSFFPTLPPKKIYPPLPWVEERKEAWATVLFSRTSRENILIQIEVIRTLAWSVRHHSIRKSRPFLVITDLDLSREYQDMLYNDYISIVRVQDEFPTFKAFGDIPNAYERFNEHEQVFENSDWAKDQLLNWWLERGATPTLVKLFVWDMIDFDRIVFLDTDTLLVQPVEELFDIPVFASGVTPDSSHHTSTGNIPLLNTGVMVVQPNQDVFDKMMATMATGDLDDSPALLHFGFSDQPWIDTFFMRAGGDRHYAQFEAPQNSTDPPRFTGCGHVFGQDLKPPWPVLPEDKLFARPQPTKKGNHFLFYFFEFVFVKTLKNIKISLICSSMIDFQFSQVPSSSMKGIVSYRCSMIFSRTIKAYTRRYSGSSGSNSMR